jgi:glycosyltransferase involved in cell wall biosynthesis
MASQAALAGHEVTIIAAWPVDSALLRDSLHPDVRVLYVSDAIDSKLGVYLSMLPWLWRHHSWLAEQDILHCHLTYGAAFGTVARFFRAAFGSQRPAVVETYHAVGMPIPKLHRWVHARMAARFDALALMVEDDYWSAFIRRRPYLPSAIIPNGISFQRLVNVDSAARLAYRREIGIPDECRYVVGTVGRLRPDRKPSLFIPIFAEIAKAFGPKVHFVIAGYGSEHDRMQSLIVEHGLEKQVHLTGLVLEMRFPLSIMDLYLTLNVGAVTGIAALEAAYLYLPVVAIQMRSGYIAQPEDWIWSSTNLSEVATKAIGLLRVPADRQVLAERQAARVRSHHTVDSMVRSYDALYRAAVERSRVGTK